MTTKKIPRATARRLPIYYRYLTILLNAKKERVSSTELSEAVQVDSATIRRDFSYFGELGKRGYGYDVASLLKFFKGDFAPGFTGQRGLGRGRQPRKRPAEL